MSNMSAHLDQTQSKSTANQAKREIQDGYDDLRADVTKLTDAVKSLAGEQLGTAVEDAQQAAEQGLAKVERSIRRNPTQAALIAAGIGFLAGLLIVR